MKQLYLPGMKHKLYFSGPTPDHAISLTSLFLCNAYFLFSKCWQFLLFPWSSKKYKLWLSISNSLYDKPLSIIGSTSESGSHRNSVPRPLLKLLDLGVSDLVINLSIEK